MGALPRDTRDSPCIGAHSNRPSLFATPKARCPVLSHGSLIFRGLHRSAHRSTLRRGAGGPGGKGIARYSLPGCARKIGTPGRSDYALCVLSEGRKADQQMAHRRPCRARDEGGRESRYPEGAVISPRHTSFEVTRCQALNCPRDSRKSMVLIALRVLPSSSVCTGTGDRKSLQ